MVKLSSLKQIMMFLNKNQTQRDQSISLCLEGQQNQVLSLCDYSDAYILVTGDITVARTIAATSDNPLQRKKTLTAAT